MGVDRTSREREQESQITVGQTNEPARKRRTGPEKASRSGIDGPVSQIGAHAIRCASRSRRQPFTTPTDYGAERPPHRLSIASKKLHVMQAEWD